MLLTYLKYKQYEGEPFEWGLETKLEKINLVVGKNASGKTKTLNIIYNLSKLISRDKSLVYGNGDYELHFQEGKQKIKYFLKYEKSEVVDEKLIIGKKHLLSRDSSGIGKIYSEEFRKHMKFQVDKNQLAVSAKKDPIQHPFIENLYNWADNLVHFSFGSELGKNNLTIFVKDEKKQDSFDIKNTDRSVTFLQRGLKKWGDEFKKSIIDNMRIVGYQIDDVDIGMPVSIHVRGNAPAPPSCLFVKEKDLKGITDQFDMSQGMYRALSLIISIAFLGFSNIHGMILIDDIGEGLDFERSSSIVDLLIGNAENKKIQLLMTTNDRFVMNIVPLKYWSIIYREGIKIEFFNEQNAPDIFRKFELTGLSNFDLFSSNFYLKFNND